MKFFVCSPTGDYIFHGTALSEQAVGIILLIMSLTLLVTCLVFMVKVLKALLHGSMAGVIMKTVNADFPGRLACLTGILHLVHRCVDGSLSYEPQP